MKEHPDRSRRLQQDSLRAKEYALAFTFARRLNKAFKFSTGLRFYKAIRQSPEQLDFEKRNLNARIILNHASDR
jgi:hypothetical protein